ncbi:ribonuclease H-like domain-containing protein [Tanacetum coccineum]
MTVHQYQLADIFTKPLDEPTFKRLIVKLVEHTAVHYSRNDIGANYLSCSTEYAEVPSLETCIPSLKFYSILVVEGANRLINILTLQLDWCGYLLCNSEDLISSLDLGNPLHLQNSDFSYNTIISVKLTSTENYRCPLSNQWERCNSIVLSWQLNSVFEDLFLGQIFSDNADEVWAELKETYDKLDGSIIFNLLQKIHSFKQGELTVSEYYHKLNSLWREFDIMTKLPKCSCVARDAVLKHNQLMKLMQFLMGLNDVFQHSRETLLDVKDAFAIVFREDSHRGIAFSSSNFVTKPWISGFVSKTNNWSNNGNKKFDNKKVGNSSNNSNNNGNNRGPNPNLLCKKRGKVTHTVDRCFDLIGYPPEYNKNPGSKPNGFKTFNANFSSTSSENGATLSFTSEQIMKLMNLVNDVPSGNMLANMAYLNLTVGHPNGTLAKIKYVGNLKLSDNVVLFDVLVVPEYCVNLLSVNKLIRDSRLLVGITESKIGHPTDQVVDVLQSELYFAKDSHVSPCDICHKIKQTRESFPLSDHKTTSIGELIHLDL